MTSSIPKQYGIVEYVPGLISYAGETVNGEPHGYGVLLGNKRVVYKGQIKNGLGYGLGQFIFKEGIFSGNQNQDGVGKGRITYNSGHIYEGDVSKNKPNGYGVIKSPNGDEYVGSFFDGLKSAFGIFQGKEGIYKGYWSNGCANTRSIYSAFFWIIESIKPFPQPVTLCYYTGETLNGLPHGKGKCILPNCDFYDGDWKEGKMHGKGKLFLRNENKTYEGDFLEGKIEGVGKIVHNDVTYIGEVKDGLPDGNGTLILYGNCFKGTFNKGLPVQGKMVWKNIGEYEGSWKEGRPAINCRF